MKQELQSVEFDEVPASSYLPSASTLTAEAFRCHSDAAKVFAEM
jgi:hypothetical protein